MEGTPLLILTRISGLTIACNAAMRAAMQALAARSVAEKYILTCLKGHGFISAGAVAISVRCTISLHNRVA